MNRRIEQRAIEIEKEVARLIKLQAEADKKAGGPALYEWMSPREIREMVIKEYEQKI